MVAPLPALKNGFVTFGSLNNFCKVNLPTLRLWAAVLGAVARSRITILAPEGSARQRIVDVFQQHGVAAERVGFVSRRPRPRYLELYRDFDISLDAIPYNGQTTSLDSLWMGVPVLTIVGQSAVGRAGLGILHNLDLPDWIAHTAKQFVDLAVRHASDVNALGRLRASLRERMRRSPLTDHERFARNIETAYRGIWQKVVNGRLDS
jgi:protein O-GlcNAc transferase